MGSSAYIFNGFAPRFTDRFHVLALTRRGHGDSDYPETGYDADTLTEDICQFMDALHIEKAILAGHSIAGVELTHFAATHPARVEKLIYLDALDDRRGLQTMQEKNPLRDVDVEKEESFPRTFEEYIATIKRDIPEFVEVWSDVWDEEFAHGVIVNEDGVYIDRMLPSVEAMMFEHLIKGYAPKRVDVKIPILSFYALGIHPLPDVYTDEQKTAFAQFYREVRTPFFQSLIAEFQNRFPYARIVVIPDGHHYCFIAQEDLVYGEMLKFLLE
jgi:non-heme chloroperoxidase